MSLKTKPKLTKPDQTVLDRQLESIAHTHTNIIRHRVEDRTCASSAASCQIKAVASCGLSFLSSTPRASHCLSTCQPVVSHQIPARQAVTCQQSRSPAGTVAVTDWRQCTSGHWQQEARESQPSWCSSAGSEQHLDRLGPVCMLLHLAIYVAVDRAHRITRTVGCSAKRSS